MQMSSHGQKRELFIITKVKSHKCIEEIGRPLPRIKSRYTYGRTSILHTSGTHKLVVSVTVKCNATAD